MTTLYAPIWIQDAGTPTYPAGTDRSLLDAVWAGGGVVGAGSFAVTTPGTGLTVTVAAGKGVIPGTDSANQGKYLVWSDGNSTVTLNAAPPSGQTRKDLIVASVQDPSAGGASGDQWVLTKVTGTATTGTPATPATPASSIVLAVVVVSSTGVVTSGSITDLRSAAQVAGAIRQIVGTTLAGTTPPVGAQFIEEDGTVVVSTNGSGQFSFSWPLTLPNGVIRCLLACGDSASGGAVLVVPLASSTGIAGVAGTAYVGATALASGTIRIHYNLKGW